MKLTTNPFVDMGPRELKILRIFILVWTVLNLIQAAITPLAHDEAYYWVWSKFLDWGYLEHPPMVALFIKIGSSLLGGELGIRLMTVLTSSFVLYWVYIKLIQKQVVLYIIIVVSIFIIHAGSFLTAPDTPFFVFTALFFIAFKKFLEEDSWRSTLLLSLAILGMIYSKYHAIVVLIPAFLFNFHLLRRRRFWFMLLAVTVCYIPHLNWLFSRGEDGLSYALGDRFNNPMSLEMIWIYISGQ